MTLLDKVLRTARPDDARISGDDAAAKRLAEVCGGLPLALQISAASLIGNEGKSARQMALCTEWMLRRALRSSSILRPWTVTTMLAVSAPVAVR